MQTVQADLALLRNGIDLYATEHGGSYPDAESIAGQLTQYTDAAGHISPSLKCERFIYGPYMRRIPPHAVTGADTICSADAPTLDAGWAYDEATGKLRIIVDPATPAGRTLARVMPNDVVRCSPADAETADGQ